MGVSTEFPHGIALGYLDSVSIEEGKLPYNDYRKYREKHDTQMLRREFHGACKNNMCNFVTASWCIPSGWHRKTFLD